MEIRRRPFSVEYFTNVMLPDGIFDTALRKQWITCHCTNTSGSALNDVTIYLESVGDPGIVPVAQSYTFPEIPAGASVRVAWLADFEAGTAGKKLVSIIAQAAGMSLARQIKQIFVSETRRDPVTGDYTCTVEEGTLKVSGLEVIGPKEEWVPCEEKQEACPPGDGPWIPSRMSMVFYPNPAYEGVHGDLPFSDPWWKILAWIVAAIAAIVAIVAAAMGEGTAGTAVSGGFDETTGDIDCCAPDPGGVPGDDSMTVAGVASAIATGAVAVGLSDDEDPWWRGQEATPPAKDEITTAEQVDARFAYPAGPPQSGEPYPMDVKWEYTRITTGESHSHAVSESQANVHVSGGVEVEVPEEHRAFEKPLVVKARFQKDVGELFSGEDLYAFALLRSPDDMYFLLDLRDDGIEEDEAPNDGTYTGALHLEEIYQRLLKRERKLEGLWRVYVFAQDVNDATSDMLPQVAAKRIGGFMIASGLKITFDPALPCPLQADATVMVVI
jgi:hypothetical protein